MKRLFLQITDVIVKRKSQTLIFVGLAMLLFAPVCSAASMSLEGQWRCAFDPGDSGEKQQWFNQRLPIIFLSGSAHEEERQQAIALGANAFVSKPFAMEALLGLLNTCARL